jgi:hypothetical protein
MAFYGGPRGPPPPPWQVVVAPGQPRPYYYNPVTNVTTWEPPPMPPPPPMSAPVPDAAPGGIPRPDPILEPERYEAWLQVTQHIQSGDKNTASFSGLQNAAGNGIKGHITDAGGLKLGDCHLYPLGACMKGDKCPHVHNRKRFGHLYNADGLPKVKPIAIDDGRSVPRYSGNRDRRAPSPRRRRSRSRSPPRRRQSPSPDDYRRRHRSRSPDYRRRSPPRSYSRRERDRYR